MTSDQNLTGIDIAIHSDLRSFHDFKKLLDSKRLTENQVEEIIERITLTKDKPRLIKWLGEAYPALCESDIKYISTRNYKDFGRLSREFLMEFEAIDQETGEIYTILKCMWDTNNNLMELLSEKYPFTEALKIIQQEYYVQHSMSIDEQLAQMHLSNATKRPVLRALDIISDIKKAFGHAPSKVFIEMTRGAKESQKNKRTQSRKQQLLELYKSCNEEDVRLLKQQLEGMGDSADTLLQSDRLFLYYIQLGRCMYTGDDIRIQDIKGGMYNIEHIYPQAYIKDDSIINNEILVKSEENGQKSDSYPINSQIQNRMRAFWNMLHSNGLISDEKYKRLTRVTGFSDDERIGFINRQLTETSQASKAVADILHKLYPDTEVVYVKARLAAEFRQEFDLVKSRLFNDLHHAKDAYLNIVVGNVYDMRFSKRWFCVKNEYSVKTKTIFTHPVVCGDRIVWNGVPMLEMVKKTMQKNNAHMTKYSFYRKSFCDNRGKRGLFDQNPHHATPGLIPLKKGLPTEVYGGYNKPTVSFFLPVRYTCGKKKDIMIMPVELMYANALLDDEQYALRYAADRIGRILNKEVKDISLPLGLRPLKVNTILSLDGFRVTIAGSSNGGKCLIAAPFMPFAESQDNQRYLKYLESFVEKTKKNPKYIYDPQYDKVTAEANLQFYDMYVSKLKNTIYAKRPNNPLKILEGGRELFAQLDTEKQAEVLLNIHQIFGRISGGIDLSAIGGAAHAAATVNFSTNVSNWKKSYSDVRIIDISASGLWEKQSPNLLDLL